ncbi:hypothetical protein H1164_15740 [Thermoactinomyces daqus]|uniref:Uncharacterized protein n=1 Tax=Thermoactinomyces daqus TaxID=1329516 RepID=A0A7W2AJZ3_9BACL|nr:hypothetical protein [Thermoactinomyces daqus]MBA4544304.1 hypothetical protein [Thermoactinomyces daqus]
MGLFEKFFKGGSSRAFEEANKNILDDYYIEKARKEREAEERRRQKEREREERLRAEAEEYDRKIREALELANRGKSKSWWDDDDDKDDDKGSGGGWFSGW